MRDFAKARRERLLKDWSSYQPRNPIASDLHDCARYQVMRVIGWKVREQPDVEGLELMEDGRVLELAALRQLTDEGHEIVEQQAPFEERQPLAIGGQKTTVLTGRMDGKLVLDKGLVAGSYRPHLAPLEVKSTSEWTVKAIDSEEDLKSHSVWTRKWWRQVQTYCLSGGYDIGFLVLCFRGQRKVIEVKLDYEAAEAILALCVWAVNLIGRAQFEGIDETTIDGWLNANGGERAAYHPKISECKRCPFWNRACFPPDVADKSAQARPDLEPVVEIYLREKGSKARYEKAQKLLVAETKGCDATVAGKFVLDGEWHTRKTKPQPAKPAGESSYWGIKVRGDAEEDE